MRLVTIDAVTDGTLGALLPSGEVVDLKRAAAPTTLEKWIPRQMQELLEAGDDGLALVRQLVRRVAALPAREADVLRSRGAILPPDTRLLSPVPRPGLIVAAGMAYRSHLQEMGGHAPPPNPTGFLKSPNSVCGPMATVAIPPGAPSNVDYEGELAIVFGRKCHGVSAGDAMNYVAGFTVANDISARDWVPAVRAAKSPLEGRTAWESNVMGKQFPGFTPLGPCLLTRDEVADVGALHLETRLNGEVMQSVRVADLIFGINQTIEYFSRWYEFAPGDVLLTGTPAGVGVGRKPQVFMKAGDVVEVEISGIGSLKNRMVSQTSDR